MSHSTDSEDDANLDVLGNFLEEFRSASLPADVVAHYCGCYPNLAQKFRDLAEINGLLERVPERSTEGFEGGGQSGESTIAHNRLGPYRILRVMGRGGMGEVFEAIEEPLERRVAVKTIRGGRNSRPDWMRRFLHERLVLARLHHTNIVPIFAAGQEGDLLYFAMPCIPGASLGQVIRTARRTGCQTPGQMASTFEDLLAAACVSEEGLAADTRIDAPSIPAAPVSLRPEYIRSIVGLMAAIAEAMHHAHEAGVIHRDLKPSNLMAEPGGHPWILDFGLALVVPGGARFQGARRPAMSAEGSTSEWESASIGVVGTPPYMAPEQHRTDGTIDARTDVWGLGVTFYELITMRAAFSGRDSVLRSEPIPPRQLVRGFPRELNAIILRALRKDPEERYATARLLSDDLRRWLQHEPITAWPTGPVARPARRAWLWSRRNKGWAAAFLAAALALAAGTTLAVIQERAERREALMQQLQRVRLTPHATGWSDTAWSLASRAAPLSGGDGGVLQAQAAATLIGLDARAAKQIALAVRTLVFDPSGRRLYMVGHDDQLEVWDAETDRRESLPRRGNGPIAFDPDGTPRQLGWSADDPLALSVHDVHAGRSTRLILPPGAPGQPRAWDLSPDASRAGACLRSEAGRDRIAIWETGDGKLVRVIDCDRASDVTLSADGRLVAAITGEGRVTVWPLPEGPPIAELGDHRVRVNSLAFGRDPNHAWSRDADATAVGSGWLLATADAGGQVVVYDLRTATPRSFCRTSRYDVYVVAFSPDGTTLATAGREQARLWDVATGRLLLGFPYRNTMNALSFTADGRRLAVASQPAFGLEAAVDVWNLEDGRGIQGLRGLQAGIEQAVFSPDGRRVAALSLDWRIGIWECFSGRLLHILDLPPGNFADNAGLAFNSDGRQFAAAAGHVATLWNLETGQVRRSWTLAEGLQESLLFDGDEHLWLARAESRNGQVPPYGRFQPENPRVCRLRDLLSDEPFRPRVEITDFPFHVNRVALSPDGRSLVVGGAGGTTGNTFAVNAYESSTGRRLWSLPAVRLSQTDRWNFDPTGTVLWVDTTSSAIDLLAMPAGNLLGRIHFRQELCLGPAGRQWMSAAPRHPLGPAELVLSERGHDRPLFMFPDDRPSRIRIKQFSPDGRRFVWGEGDGTVSVIDLTEAQRRLASLGLGW